MLSANSMRPSLVMSLKFLPVIILRNSMIFFFLKFQWKFYRKFPWKLIRKTSFGNRFGNSFGFVLEPHSVISLQIYSGFFFLDISVIIWHFLRQFIWDSLWKFYSIFFLFFWQFLLVLKIPLATVLQIISVVHLKILKSTMEFSNFQQMGSRKFKGTPKGIAV